MHRLTMADTVLEERSAKERMRRSKWGFGRNPTRLYFVADGAFRRLERLGMRGFYPRNSCLTRETFQGGLLLLNKVRRLIRNEEAERKQEEGRVRSEVLGASHANASG